MSTTVAPQTTIKLSELKVVPEDNPRGIVTKNDALEDLAGSIKRDGLLQPVLAVKTEEGDIKLTAGYRRVEASKLAGLKEIPVFVRELSDVEGAAFDENEQREEMTPMARAKSLARQKSMLGTNKKVADRRSLTAQQVGQLISMTELPESVQEIAMNDRQFGPVIAKELTRVSSTTGGEAVALYITNRGTEAPKVYSAFAKNPDQMLNEIRAYRSEHALDKEAIAQVPEVIDVYCVDPRTLTDDAEKLAAWEERAYAIKEVLGYSARSIDPPQPYMDREHIEYHFGEIELDALRAAGSLFEEQRSDDDEERHFGRAWAYTFDTDLIVDQIEQLLTRYETQVEEVKKEREEEIRAEAEAAGLDPDEAQAAAEAPAKSKNAIAKEEAAKARVNNEFIGDKLLAKSSKPISKTRTLAAVKIMAKSTVGCDNSMAAAGNRLVFKSWKEVEIKELKSGEKREKVHYLDSPDAHTRLMESIDAAKTVEEVVSIVTTAMVAAMFGDEKELPQSKRVHYGSKPRYVDRDDLKTIDEFAKGCLPKEVEEARVKSRERGF